MTKEEAIDCLKWWDISIETAGVPKYSSARQALDMAIESLQKYETFCGVPMEEAYKVMRGYSLGEYAEVVRCKDCKNYSVEGKTIQFGWCNALEMPTDEQRFCADGERSDKDDE